MSAGARGCLVTLVLAASVAAASGIYIPLEERWGTHKTPPPVQLGPMIWDRCEGPAGKSSSWWLCDKCGGKEETEMAMDAHLVTCEAIEKPRPTGSLEDLARELDGGIDFRADDREEQGEMEWGPDWCNEDLPQGLMFLPLCPTVVGALLPSPRRHFSCPSNRPGAAARRAGVAGLSLAGSLGRPPRAPLPRPWRGAGRSRVGGLGAGVGGEGGDEIVVGEVLDETTYTPRDLKYADGTSGVRGGAGVERRGVVGRLRGWALKGISDVVRGGSKDKNALMRVGFSALMSYGLISHITYGACLIISWVVHGTRTGLSPLVVGQWMPFFSIYLAFCAGLVWFRPARLALSLFLAPKIDAAATALQSKVGITKNQALGVYAAMLNVLIPLLFLHGGLYFATKYAASPWLPPRSYSPLELGLAIGGATVGQCLCGPMGSIAGIMWLFEFKWWRVLTAIVVG